MSDRGREPTSHTKPYYAEASSASRSTSSQHKQNDSSRPARPIGRLELADRAPYPLRELFGTLPGPYSGTHWGSRFVFGIIDITDADFKFLLLRRRGPYKLLDLTDIAVREAICRLFDRYPRVGYQYLAELYCAKPGQWDPAPLFE